MERLPKETLINAINTYKTVIEAVDGKDTDYCPVLDKVTVALLEELKAYRDAEEQGLLLRLPCKVGDTVYCLWETLDFKRNKVKREIITEEFELSMLEGFGKSLFMTLEEAEKMLESMQGE